MSNKLEYHFKKPTLAQRIRRKARDSFRKNKKSRVNYRQPRDLPMDRQHEVCGNCAFFVRQLDHFEYDVCEQVEGRIERTYTCELFKKGVQVL